MQNRTSTITVLLPRLWTTQARTAVLVAVTVTFVGMSGSNTGGSVGPGSVGSGTTWRGGLFLAQADPGGERERESVIGRRERNGRIIGRNGRITGRNGRIIGWNGRIIGQNGRRGGSGVRKRETIQLKLPRKGKGWTWGKKAEGKFNMQFRENKSVSRCGEKGRGNTLIKEKERISQRENISRRERM